MTTHGGGTQLTVEVSLEEVGAAQVPDTVIDRLAVDVASKLADFDVRTTDQLRARVHTDALEAVEHAWRTAPGQRSGITWEYALMLAQVPGVKADRMVIAYTARALGVASHRLLPTQAAALVSRVAHDQNWDVIRLDHTIWRFESGRDFNHRLPTA